MGCLLGRSALGVAFLIGETLVVELFEVLLELFFALFLPVNVRIRESGSVSGSDLVGLGQDDSQGWLALVLLSLLENGLDLLLLLHR